MSLNWSRCAQSFLQSCVLAILDLILFLCCRAGGAPVRSFVQPSFLERCLCSFRCTWYSTLVSMHLPSTRCGLSAGKEVQKDIRSKYGNGVSNVNMIRVLCTSVSAFPDQTCQSQLCFVNTHVYVISLWSYNSSASPAFFYIHTHTYIYINIYIYSMEVPPTDVCFLNSFSVQGQMRVSAGLLFAIVPSCVGGSSICFTRPFSLALILLILEWWLAWTGSAQPFCQPCYQMSVGSKDAQRVSWEAVCFN